MDAFRVAVLSCWIVPNGSKNPAGSLLPTRPSALMESLATEALETEAGLKATADTASDAKTIDLNIFECSIVQLQIIVDVAK